MEKHQKPSGYSCKSCTRPDTEEEKWVACDSCKLWEHFDCAGVDESVQNRPYHCKECITKATVPKTSSSHGLKPPSEGRSLRSSTARSGLKPVNRVTQLASKFSRSANSTTSSVRAAHLQAQMKLVEEEQLLKEQELDAQEMMRKKELEEEERQLEERKALLEAEAKLRQRKLREEQEYQRKQQMIRKESLEKKNSIARQLSECSSRCESIPDSEKRVSQWLQQCDESLRNDPEESGLAGANPLRPNNQSGAEIVLERQLSRISLEATNHQRPAAVQACSDPNVGQEARPLRHANCEIPASVQVNQNLPSNIFDRSVHPYTDTDRQPVPQREPEIQPSRSPNQPRQLSPLALPQPSINPAVVGFPAALSASQLAARQVMGKDLPNFSGNPEDWPIFISSFEQSTAACGYTDTENLMRLQRCLKGHAHESVRSRLLLPSSVPQVLKTLQTLYGRPEILIRTLIEKVHRTPAPRHDRLETVIEFGLVVQNLVDHLKAAKQYTHLANPVLMQELVEKLPGSLKMDWAIYKSKQPYATLATFGDFMTGLVDAASQVTFELPSSTQNFRSEQRRSKEKSTLHTHSLMPSHLEPLNPPSNQSKSDCHHFKALNIEERRKVVQQKGLCETCLNGHGKWPCKSWQGCGFEGCRKKHHTLLHPFSSQSTSNVCINHLMHNSGASPMFRVLPVVLYAQNRREVVFAFVDEGSSNTFVEETVADRLGVSGPVEPLTLEWTGKVTREERRSQRVQLDISGEDSSSRHMLREVRTVGCLVLPVQSMKYGELCHRYPHLRGLPLKDYELVQPKLLIGLDNLRLVVPLKVREGGITDPIAAKCRLGWSIYGCLAGSPSARAVVHFHVAAHEDKDRLLNEQLRDYFALEDAGVSGQSELLESDDEIRARAILQQTTKRTQSGFETGLLWRNDDPDFPDSYPMAVHRLKALERKLAKNTFLHDRVREQIDEYVQKGYAHKATELELKSVDPKRVWFLPLGVVVHPKKPNKIRLVWDAAATVNGVSFNSKLLKGPDLLTPLPAVLNRFRQYPVAVCGDIKEMFHQLLIREQDRTSQCFLWRRSTADPIQIYVMDVATFGATCSPASAQYVKNLNAQEFAELYPRGVNAIIKNHYVDDYLDSFKTVEEATSVVKEVTLIHSFGGFEIRGFRSNSTELLRELGQNVADEPKNLMLERSSISESVLGMTWDPKDDSFSYAFHLRDNLRSILDEAYVPTKREVLKVVMSLFDPLGLVSHFLVHGKVIIQGTWAAGTGWDEPINEDLNQKWRQWVSLFPKLDELKIPRCYFSLFPSSLDDLQVHTFVDASDIAYTCVVYFRLVYDGHIQIALVGAKTKVAPLKTLSTPRLELKAAVLGVRFVAAILEYHSLPTSKRFFWSDSTTVLAWIRSDHRRFHKFVSVRVGEILTLSEPQEWRWVQSSLNVSDDATKWKNGPNLDWFNGPRFLRLDEAYWPEQQCTTTTHEEIRRIHTHRHREPVVDYSRFNRWKKLHRVIAYVIRFTDSARRRNVGRKLQMKLLTQEELEQAEILLWKMAQEEAFAEERSILAKSIGSPEDKHATVPKSSSIFKTWPYMDTKGLLRMRGRIGAADYLPFAARFPVILPKEHPVTILIVDWFHCAFRHANRETIINELRQRFEISRLRSVVQKVANNCAWCQVNKAIPKPPVMAPLPYERLEPFVRPFTYVGLDYFGPVLVKVGRSQAKRWIALFTCLSIRAVHMEVVHSLSTESCIMVVRRFVSRRGSPAVFYSDNGTCFQGANKQLQEEIVDEVASTFTNAETKWKFIPPASPHMGGVWERLVRSIKTAIGTALEHPRKPDDETLETIVNEAEALVNSRPLTYIPLETATQESLTPNHFLLGSSTGNKTEPSEVAEHATLRSSWKMAQHIVGEFWKRWVKEYLPVITRRNKWFKETKDLAEGDLVLIVNGNGRTQWIRGRVEKTVVGRDGRVRQAQVRTTSGLLRRPVVKLAVLDVVERCEPTGQQEDQGHHLGSRVGVCADNTPR